MEFDTINRNDRPNYNDLRPDERPTLPKTSHECPDCKDNGIVKEQDGSVHTCWKCLETGKLDVHSKNIPENKEVKL
tara:strand:- start:194 stop:421 length:228 start_codon:yes stop_codon:yes gene_type:complete